MFKSFQRDFHVLFILLIGSLLLTGCDINKAKDAFNKVSLVIGLKPITTTVSGQFLDGKTGDLIQNVTVKFIGNDAGDVIDMFSDPLSQQTFKGGFATFGINNNLTPSSSSPVTFTVVAQAPGYVTAYKKVTLTSTDHFSFVATMANKNNLPPGTSTGSNNSATAGSNGTVSQGYSVQTTSNSGSTSNASMSVPSNTIMTDASGNPLSGTLTSQMIYFNGDSTKAIHQIPGGSDDGSISTGFAQIKITDASGKKAAKFSKPVTIHSEVSSSFINPATGNPVKNGDSLEVQSYNENTGQWKKEGMAVLKGPNNGGNYDVYFQISHLSFWKFILPKVKLTKNGATINIQRNGNDGVLTGDASTYGYTLNFSVPANINKIMLPQSIGLEYIPEITANITLNGISGGVTQKINLGSGSYNFNLPAPSGNKIDVTFNLVPKCSDTSKKVHVTSIPTSEVYYQQTGPEWIDAGQPDWNFDKNTSVLSGGTLTVNGLIQGKTYTFKTAFDGKTYTKVINITSKKMTVSQVISGGYCKK